MQIRKHFFKLCDELAINALISTVVLQQFG